MVSVLFYRYSFFNDPATTEISTLSLHDALPISRHESRAALVTPQRASSQMPSAPMSSPISRRNRSRSEEHTSELQSQSNLVCRLLLEKKKKLRQHLFISITTLCKPTYTFID